MWKKVTIGVIAAIIAAGAVIYAVNHFADKPTDTASDEAVQTENAQTETVQTENEAAEGKANDSEESTAESAKGEADEVYTPTFMYFISNSDSDFDKTNETIDELKKEYAGKVNFDIRNIDKTPEDKENFPVEGNTPMLIMLNKSNDISAFNPMCNDKETLREIIEAALK